MGFEVFRVELRGDAPAELGREAIRALPGVTDDPDGGFLPGEYFRVRHDRHVIELHLSEHPPSLSVRFPLANPPSVDEVFMAVVRHLMTHAGLRARVLDDDVPEEHAGGFTLDQFDQFAAHARRCIAAERRVWVTMFGPNTHAGSTAEVFRDVILPRCEPVG
jgi:hypothetical protein